MSGSTPCVAQDLEAALLRCGTGSEEAFAEVYDRTVRQSLRLAWCSARERVAAERIVLDAYVEVWRTASCYDPASGSAVAWVLAAVRRQAMPPAP